MPQEIIFTTLPHHRTEVNGEPFLKLSVYTTIKLSTPKDTTLADFEDILQFPDKILNAAFQFRLNNGKILDATLLSEKIDADLFHNIFHSGIKVDDFKEEDLSKKNIYSFPMKHISEFVLNSYRNLAVSSPTKLVSPEIFIDDTQLGAITPMQLDVTNIEKVDQPQQRRAPLKASNFFFKNDNDARVMRTELQRNKFIPYSRQMKPKDDFVQLRQFHKVDKKVATQLAQIQIEKPRFEFHDITSVVNSYPQIMRKLGLVLDFLIPYDSSIPNSGTISLVVNALELQEEGTTVSLPATAYSITDAGFYIADKPNTMFKQGFVKINTDEFSVVQIDADGTALKTSNMAENKVQQIARFYEVKSELVRSKRLQAKQEEDDAEPPEDEGLPYMRSAGIAITKNGMAEHLFARWNNNLQLKQQFMAAPVKKMQMQPRKLQQQGTIQDTVQQQDTTPKVEQRSNLQNVQKQVDVQNIQKQAIANLALNIKVPQTVFYSNDVIQGYRMDIAYEDEPEKWYSLHQRQDDYTWFDEQNNPFPITGIEPDEGCIQLGVAEDAENKEDVFVSETLARWEGWSLSVRKPGYAINEAEDYQLKPGETEKRDFVYKSKQQEIKKYQFDPDLEFKVNAQSKIVPGTLPKLRFGKNYRIRVRAVDLAGNSVPLEHQTESPAETERANVQYMRYEPLASPIVLVGNELKDGEFLERMVVRSNFDQSVKDYENTHKVNGKTFDAYSQRYLLPPKNSQLMAETHGKFEQAFQNNPAATQQIYNIIASHEGLYQQDEKNKEKVYQPSEVEIIYLPDPMAAGVSLFVAEGYESTHTQEFEPKMFSFFDKSEIQPKNTNDITIPDDWYNAGAIRIRLEEGEQKADWNPGARTFTVFLPKGIRTRIKFSTFWREEDLKQLSAIWEMMKNDNPGNIAELDKLATAGQHWMVSPSREMELVHAVQQPVDPPVIQKLIPDRDFNTTFALINTRFDIHGESTEKVEFQAKWTEPMDDGISVTIKEKQGRNSIPDITINYHDDIVTKGTIPKPVELVKPSIENLQVTPILRFKPRTFQQFEADPQPEARKVNQLYKVQNNRFQQVQKLKVSPKKNLAQRVKFDIESTKFSFLKLMNLRIKPLEHHFGDTKHRWVDYKLVAASRYREYFDKILTGNPALTTTRESEWMEKVNILSSARPKTPEIDYIVPTFEWRKTQTSDAVRHVRMGGGLRIYLKRPWYSSGDDEMLAVVLPDNNGNFRILNANGGYTNLYTHWGIDPVLYGERPQNVSPQISDFRMNPVVDNKLAYPDKPGTVAKVVAYPVRFDEERQMWYCDLAINPGNMYFPFVKLYLARYQPYSVREENNDVCLSQVVVAKMTQLVPERQTTLRFKKDDQNSKFTITVEGNIYNPGDTPYGNFNFLRISFLDSAFAQPIYGIVDDGENARKLEGEGVTIQISRKELVSGTRFKVEREFRLNRDYKTAPFQVIIEEYERGPNRIPNLPPDYRNRLEQSEQTDRLVYADVIKINEVEK